MSVHVKIYRHGDRTELEKQLSRDRNFLCSEASRYRELSEAQAILLLNHKDRIMDLEEALGQEVDVNEKQTALLRECESLVSGLAKINVSKAWPGYIMVSFFETKKIAQALLPKLEEAVKEVEGGIL